jgi:hypothetical protein
MIRPLTFLSLVAAAGAGLHLYSVKHEVSQLEKTLRETVRQTEQARERTAVLRAEWALLNEPERLRAAATRNLPLEVMQTSQFVRAAELERRLPAAVAFAGAPSLFAPPPAEHSGEQPAAIAVASTAGADGVAADAAAAALTARAAQAAAAAAAHAPAAVSTAQAAPAPPAAAPRATVQVATARTAPPPAERAAPARVAAAPAPQVAAIRPPEPREVPRSVPRAAIAKARAVERDAAPEADREINIANRPQPAALLRTAMHVRPSAPPPRVPELPAATGSMLGGIGRPLLAPPVPVASASAATLR